MTIHKCKQCVLFDPKNKSCGVTVLHEGEKVHIPTEAEDDCFFETPWLNPETNKWECFLEDIKQIRMWAEDGKGNKINGLESKGIIKIELPGK